MRYSLFLLLALVASVTACGRGRASRDPAQTAQATDTNSAAEPAATCLRYQGTLPAAASRSAYPTAIVQPPGQPWSYIAWMWRETPDVATDHTISIARSLDLKNWQDTCGATISLPMTLNNTEVVDSVGVGEGLVNYETLSYDAQNRLVITYVKYVNQAGAHTSQVFNARRDPDGWKIFQMTHWNTAWNVSGGGSLPVTPFTEAASGIQIDSHGQTYQTFTRAAADTTGIPSSGKYVIDTDGDGNMLVGAPYQAPTVGTTDFEWNPPRAVAAAALDPCSVHLATPFAIHVLPSRYQDRWVPIRGDWDGQGADEAGLYDAYMSTFYTWSAGGANHFQFGKLSATQQYQPMVGDWLHDGKDTVGLYSSALNQSWLADELQDGPAAATFSGQPTTSQGLKDAPWLWHSWDPAKQYFIRWEAMPPNRDLPYDCGGNPLPNQDQNSIAPATCPENFISNLTVWEFNKTTNAWTSSIIDQQWGGSPADFDFLTFKNYQIVAYYNATRHLTLATRPIGGPWTIQPTDSVFTGWDGHNFLTVAVDPRDDIHVSGNMHGAPLNYFRTAGLSASTLQRAPMVGNLEDQVTYPSFLYTPQGVFGFLYRDGASGDGNTYVNTYDITTQSWQHLNTQPIFAGATSP